MLFKFRDSLQRFVFGYSCRSIRSTEPIEPGHRGAVALMAQLQHKDVLMALLAFKSFVARVPVGAYFVLNDGSLTAADRDLLCCHVPGVQFLRMEDGRSGSCPQGGCWERLLSISRLVKDYYVVQLDSDTLTLGDLPEVAECVKANRSFVIGTSDGQEFESMTYRQGKTAARVAKSSGTPHIQLAAEANFHKLERFKELKYVRGCAGFSGFRKGSFDRSFVEEISIQMSHALGERWREWGSEQVMSNIVVANTRDARVLPHPKYCDCNKYRPNETAFMHFVGSCRFKNGIYRKSARQAISELRRASAVVTS